MGFRSAKHKSIQDVALSFGGGVNLYEAPQDIPDGQCAYLLNMMYAGREGSPVSRTGLAFVAQPPGAGVGITKLHHYEKNATEAHLVAAMDNGRLYRLSGQEWVQIATLNPNCDTPCMVTFNGRLIVADGSAHMHFWDGQTYSEIPTSPQATAVIEAGNRLVANSSQDLDGVYFSGPEDELEWNTGQGGKASFYRVGYRDALRVVALCPFGQEVLVFKRGASSGSIYRVNMAGAQPWSVAPLSLSVTATGHGAVAFVQNNVLFGSDSGILDIAGVVQYGELQVGNAGRAINPFLSGKRVREITYAVSLGIVLCMVAGDHRVLCYHPHNGAWSILDYQQIMLHTACQAGDTVYMAGANGPLYRITHGEDRDETSPGQFAAYPCLLRARTLLFSCDAVLRRVRLQYESASDAAGTVSYRGIDSAEPMTLLDFHATAAHGQLYDGTMPLAQAGQLLGAFAVDTATGFCRARDKAVTFEIKTTHGRVKLRQLAAELAAVNG